MRPLFAAPLALFSSYGWAQQLVAVPPPSDSSGFIAVAIIAAVGGLAFLKIKKPELFDSLVAKAKKIVGLGKKIASSPVIDSVQREALRLADKALSHTALPETVSRAPKPVPPMSPAEALAFLRANYPELIVQTPPPPPPATPDGPKFIDGRLVG